MSFQIPSLHGFLISCCCEEGISLAMLAQVEWTLGGFLVGNCIAILSSLATPEQATAIMDLIEEHWEVLIGEMPLKIAHPALEGHDWRVITGSDPKNTAWSYHNGGSWPTLLWLFTASCIKASRMEMAKRAIEQVEWRMLKDNWPEYYDRNVGRCEGKEARKSVPRTVAGYLVAKLMMENPATLHLVQIEPFQVEEAFAFWGTPEGDLVHPAECMQQLLEKVRRHRVNVDGNVCTHCHGMAAET